MKSFVIINDLFFFIFFLSCPIIQQSLCENDEKDFMNFLIDSYKKDEQIRRAPMKKEEKAPSNGKLADIVQLPAGYNPLPGRTSFGDYWPLYPLANQYHAGISYDTSRAKHVGGDILIPVPYWNNFLNLGGHFIERVQEEWVKVGYVNTPVNMLGLTKDQIVRLMSDPSLHWNRQIHPNIPVGTLPGEYTPISCKPPLCNPYQATIGVGVEANYHIEDGFEGELDVPIPIGKNIAYRYPLSGNIHFDHDDTSVNYGQNLGPLDPLAMGFPNETPLKKKL